MKLNKFFFLLKVAGCFLILVFAGFFGEILYCFFIFSEIEAQPKEGYDLVLMYTGTSDLKKTVNLALSGRTPLFVSGAGESELAISKAQTIMGNFSVIYDPRALTTDQNARYTAPFIRKKGWQRVLLVTGWDHLPRALFLTRFYLIGSGVTVIPCANGPAPKDWWRYQQAWVQLFKFWGSLGRIVLHEVGIDNWPPPEWMP